jgi:serine/threonine protein kinase
MSLPVRASSVSAPLADPEFNELVCRAAEDLELGRPLDLAAIHATRPKYAERLERLLPTLEAMAALGQSGIRSQFLSTGSLPASESPNLADALGEFRIIGEIGRGGMGVVYEAEQVSLSRRVALKVLPFAAMLSEAPLQRFKNEARAAASLEHDHIVSIYVVGCDRGVHYFAMQLVQGQSLAELIQRLRSRSGLKSSPALEAHTTAMNASTSDSLSRDEGRRHIVNPGHSKISPDSDPESPGYFRGIATLGVEAAEALDYAHQQGVLHRDVKPANLLLDHAGKVWVTDFGLARTEADAGLTMTGDLVGTLRYMSPEQVLSQESIDCRTDVYSLGVTLYELATLEPAFHHASRARLIHDIVFERIRPASTVNRHVPAALDAIIFKATERDPGNRYASARELAEDLRKFLNDEPVNAACRRPLALRWRSRRTWAVATAVLAILLGCAFGGLTVLVRDRDGEETARLHLETGDVLEVSEAPPAAEPAPASPPRPIDTTPPQEVKAEPPQQADALQLEADEPSGKYSLFAPTWSAEALKRLGDGLDREEARKVSTPIKTLSDLDPQDSSVLIVAMDGPGFLKIGDYNLEQLKQKKIIGIGYGAAKLFGELGLAINGGACAHGVVGPPRIRIGSNRLINDSLFAGPLFVFEPAILDEKNFHNDLFFGMYIGSKKPDRRDFVDIVAIQTASENYAPIVRQGDKVLICVDAPANQWSETMTRLVSEIAAALDSRRASRPSENSEARTSAR